MTTAPLIPGIPIPGAPGNFLHVDLTSPGVLLPTTVGTSGIASFTVAIPPALAGAFYSQWAVVDPPADAVGFVTSAGLSAVF